MSRIILTFGHIPSYLGGKQSSGLSNVIWSIANNINKCAKNELNVIIAATDIHQSNSTINNTTIIGWLKIDLIIYAILNFLLIPYYCIKAFKLWFKYRLPFINTFAKLIFYHKTINQIQPDIIHLHGCTAVIFFELLGFNNYKTIITFHGISGQDKLIPGFKYYRKMEKDLCSLPIKLGFFISSKLIADWKKYYGKPEWGMKVIINAYNSEFFFLNSERKRIDNKITIATIGSISLLKGQLRVIDALSKINNTNIHYICIGGGNKKDINTLLDAAHKKNISFDYTGYLSPPEINNVLSKIDFMILPSSSEGFGLVFLESIACGVPVILPKALPIVYENGILNSNNSILLENEDSDSIVDVLKELDRYKQIFNRDEVSRSVKNYNWESIAIQYINEINRLFNN